MDSFEKETAMSEISTRQKLYPWLVVLACGMMACGSIGLCTIIMGSFYVPVSESLGVEESSVAFYMTIVCLGQAVGMPLAGRLVPKMNIAVHLTLINALQAAAVVVMALYGQVWMWYLSGAIIGVCMGFNTSVGLAIILGNWFSKKTGFAIGMAWAISSVINAIMSPVMTAIIQAVGWRIAYVFLGLFAAALMCLPTLCIIRLYPSQKGLLPFGHGEPDALEGEEALRGVSFRAAVPSVAFCLLILAMALIVMTTVTNQLFPTYAVSVGFTPAIGSMMVSAAFICDIAFNPLIGWTCDKFGADKGVLMWTGVTILSFVVLSLSSASPVLACIGAGLNDSMYAVFGTGIAMLSLAMFGKKDYAKIYSLVPALGYLLGMFGLPILTKIYEVTGGFLSVWMVCLACDVAIALCVIFGMKLAQRMDHEPDPQALAEFRAGQSQAGVQHDAQ